MEGGAVWIDGESLLNLGESLSTVSLGDGDRGEQGMSIGVIRVQGKDCVGLICRAGLLFAGNQQVAQIDACLNVIRLKIDGAHQLAIGGHDRSLFQKDLGELVVSLGEVAIYLEGVGELDGRFLQFALVGVALAAFKVSLLFLVGIAMTTHRKT